MVPQKWNDLAILINERRPNYRGIVVIHGSDTLMYTAAGELHTMQTARKNIKLIYLFSATLCVAARSSAGYLHRIHETLGQS